MSSVTVNIKVSGVEGVIAALNRLGDKVRNRVMMQSVKVAAKTPQGVIALAALNPSKGQAKSERRNTGNLSQSIQVRTKRYQNGMVAWAGVGPATSTPYKGYHGFLVEFGHRIVVGGTVNRLDKLGRERANTAAVYKPGSRFAMKIYLGTQSRYRKRTRALFRMLRKEGATIEELLSRLNFERLSGEKTKLGSLARQTGAIYEKRVGTRGGGRILGRVPAYPFVGPSFRQVEHATNTTLIRELERRIKTELSKQ